MSTVELKNILLNQIAAINDERFLTAIKTFIEEKSESKIYITTSEQKRRIKEGREQIANGKSFSNKQVEIEIDEWLKEK
jgi:hypothetical protein